MTIPSLTTAIRSVAFGMQPSAPTKSWMWNVTIPEPGGGRGTNPSLEEAKAGFKESWLKFKAEIGPERLASALVICRDGRVAKADIESTGRQNRVMFPIGPRSRCVPWDGTGLFRPLVA